MDFTLIHVALTSVAVLGLWNVFRLLLTKNRLNNIPGPKASSWWKGNISQVFDSSANGWRFHQELAEFGGVTKINNLFGSKSLYVSDPLALHHVVVKEQYVYQRTELGLKTSRLFFGPGLLAVEGEQHRKQRKMLNPVFNTSHMRRMVPTFYRITNQLRDVLASKVKNGPQEIDVLIWLTHTALELVGQGGLGHSFDILREDSVSPYAQAIKSFVPTIFELFILRRIALAFMNIGPPGFRRFIVDMVPEKTVQKLKHMSDIMDQTSLEIHRSKMTALGQGDEAVSKQMDEGKDIMSILVQANTRASKEERLPEDEVIGQMSTLIFAAMDTTSSALSRILDLLALHPDVQEKLRQEVTEAQKNGEMSYDGLDKLPYLDAVCRETLRLYCPVPFVLREACKDSVLPLSSPITGVDGTEIREIHVPKGTQIFVGIMAANRNKAIWGEDAHEWKPERWLKPLPDSVSQAHLPGVYSNMMTFLGGTRACIGFKFSELEMKIVLAVLLEAFRVSPAKKETNWRLATIVTPSVTGSTSKEPQLVLKVESVARG